MDAEPGSDARSPAGTRPPEGGAPDPPRRTSGGSAPRVVLILVIGLLMVGETALTPFLPQLFHTLFGIEGTAATGLYVWVARVTGFLALPLWGLAARRWPLHRLVVVGLCATAVLDLALGLSPTYAVFTGLSAAGAASGSALLLAYPALVASYERGGGSGGDRLPGVRAFVVVFHVSVVVSTLAGAAVMALPEPRVGISAFAALDVVLAVLCHRLLGRDGIAAGTGATADDPPTPARPRRPRPRLGSARVRRIAAVAALAVVFEIGMNVIRPFFTAYAAEGGFGTTVGGLLFLLPSIAALAAIPFAERVRQRLPRAFLPAALAIAAAGLAWQVVGPEAAHLIGGRILFGVGLGLGHVALDLRMFEATGTAGPAYTAVETARTGALFLTPVIAASAASSALALPLAIGALLYLAAAALAPWLAAHPDPKESRVRDPDHPC